MSFLNYHFGQPLFEVAHMLSLLLFPMLTSLLPRLSKEGEVYLLQYRSRVGVSAVRIIAEKRSYAITIMYYWYRINFS
jgi:hypothetical protein